MLRKNRRAAALMAAIVFAGVTDDRATAEDASPCEGAGCAALRWAPPVLANPTVVMVPRNYFEAEFAVDEDVLLVMPGQSAPDGRRNPADGPRQSDLQLKGGRNIRIIGGEAGAGRMIFGDLHGSVFLEGLTFELAPGKDAINVAGSDGTHPDVYLQNIRVSGVSGAFDAVHADIFQPWGPIGHLRVDMFSGGTTYQGFFLAPQADILSVDISRTNLFYEGPADRTTYLYWFTEEGKPYYPVRLDDVWADPRPGEDFAQQALWPPASEEHGVILHDDGSLACWPAETLIDGCVRAGRPPDGDFVRGDLGEAYVSPGYQTP